MVACGIKHDVIAEAVGVSDVTLRKHYANELAHGQDVVAARVANALVDKALSDRPDAVNAAKFYLQARAGWAEKQEQKLSGSVGIGWLTDTTEGS